MYNNDLVDFDNYVNVNFNIDKVMKAVLNTDQRENTHRNPITKKTVTEKQFPINVANDAKDYSVALFEEYEKLNKEEHCDINKRHLNPVSNSKLDWTMMIFDNDLDAIKTNVLNTTFAQDINLAANEFCSEKKKHIYEQEHKNIKNKLKSKDVYECIDNYCGEELKKSSKEQLGCSSTTVRTAIMGEQSARFAVASVLNRIKTLTIVPPISIQYMSGDNQSYDKFSQKCCNTALVNINIPEKFGKYPIKGSFLYHLGSSDGGGHFCSYAYEIDEYGNFTVASLNSAGGGDSVEISGGFIEEMEKAGFNYIGPKKWTGSKYCSVPMRPSVNGKLFVLQGMGEEFFKEKNWRKYSKKLSKSFHSASCYKCSVVNNLILDNINLLEAAKQKYPKCRKNTNDNKFKEIQKKIIKNSSECDIDIELLSRLSDESMFYFQSSEQEKYIAEIFESVFPNLKNCKSFRDFIKQTINKIKTLNIHTTKNTTTTSIRPECIEIINKKLTGMGQKPLSFSATLPAPKIQQQILPNINMMDPYQQWLWQLINQQQIINQQMNYQWNNQQCFNQLANFPPCQQHMNFQKPITNQIFPKITPVLQNNYGQQNQPKQIDLQLDLFKEFYDKFNPIKIGTNKRYKPIFLDANYINYYFNILDDESISYNNYFTLNTQVLSCLRKFFKLYDKSEKRKNNSYSYDELKERYSKILNIIVGVYINYINNCNDGNEDTQKLADLLNLSHTYVANELFGNFHKNFKNSSQEPLLLVKYLIGICKEHCHECNIQQYLNQQKQQQFKLPILKNNMEVERQNNLAPAPSYKIPVVNNKNKHITIRKQNNNIAPLENNLLQNNNLFAIGNDKIKNNKIEENKEFYNNLLGINANEQSKLPPIRRRGRVRRRNRGEIFNDISLKHNLFH